MRFSRWVCAPLVLSAALFSASCGDDGESTGSAGASGSAGSAPGGTASVAGSASGGAASGGSGGRAGTNTAGSSSVSGAGGGAAGGGGGRIYTTRPDFCTPHCEGRCLCNVKACPDGQAFDENPAVCTCIPAVTPPLDCGDIDCPDGTDCETVLRSAICVKRFAP